MMAQRHMHEFGTTREQLAQIALNGRANAGSQPERHLPRPDDARRLPERPHGVDAAVPLRLRRAGRRLDRGDRVAGRLGRPTCASRRCASRPWASALHGRPSWDQFDDLTTMALRDASTMMWDRTDLTPGRRRHRPSSTTASASSRCAGSRPSASAGTARAAPGWPRVDRPLATRRCRSTPTAASSRPVACTATGSSTRPACSSGARAASARSAPPRSRSPRPAAARWPPAFLLRRS